MRHHPLLPAALALALLSAACGSGGPRPAQAPALTPASESAPQSPMTDAPDTPPRPERVVKTEAEWKELLSAEEFRVTRRAGTERAFTGRYWDTKTVGTYQCVCCATPLFRSDTKFDSGCGWPSFDDEIPGAITRKADNSFGMRRVEILCTNCGGHLGHVFEGERMTPKNVRHCVNSLSIRFVVAE